MNKHFFYLKSRCSVSPIFIQKWQHRLLISWCASTLIHFCGIVDQVFSFWVLLIYNLLLLFNFLYTDMVIIFQNDVKLHCFIKKCKICSNTCTWNFKLFQCVWICCACPWTYGVPKSIAAEENSWGNTARWNEKCHFNLFRSLSKSTLNHCNSLFVMIRPLINV